MEKKLGIVLVLVAIILFGCSIAIFYYKPKTSTASGSLKEHKYRKHNGLKNVIKSINNTEKQLNNITNMINATTPSNETTNVLPNTTINTTQINNSTELNNTSIISVVDNISNVSNITDVLI